MNRPLGGIALSLVVACAAGCTGTIGGADDDGDDGGPVTLAFTTPTAGGEHPRDTVEPSLGWRAAVVDVEVAVTGAPARVELSVGDVALGTLDASGRGQAVLVERGVTTLTATARDAGGAVVATASVDVTVVEPTVADCLGWLDLYGIPYDVGPARQGVPDPVTLTTPINGIPYRYLGNTGVRPTFFMDCSLARSLLEAAPHLRARGVVEVTDIGVYNYRCIGSGTPPDCPSGLSQHAYARGIDIAGFTDADGIYYSVNDDWVIDPTSEPTCAAATEGDKDTFLHEVICELKQHGIWNIVLTPNYNSAHRNHFHVDLTPGANFIRKPVAGGADLAADLAADDELGVETRLDLGPDAH